MNLLSPCDALSRHTLCGHHFPGFPDIHPRKKGSRHSKCGVRTKNAAAKVNNKNDPKSGSRVTFGLPVKVTRKVTSCWGNIEFWVTSSHFYRKVTFESLLRSLNYLVVRGVLGLRTLFRLWAFKMPRTPNLSKIYPSDCFWGFQSGGLKFVKNLSKLEKFGGNCGFKFWQIFDKFQSPWLEPPKTIAGINFGPIWGSGHFWMLKGAQTMKSKLWTETLEFSRLKLPNSLFALHGLAPP